MEYLKQRFGVNMTHVPYRNTPQSITDIVAGHVQLGFVEAGASLPLIREGKLRALAVSASTRLPLLPDVLPFAKPPTLRDSKPCPGTCCSRRRRHRSRSSTGCTRK
jgi:tripartite-type tricarboxylate transporter receptor subunit TctC